ncbi:hypothetical protein PHYPSEUDO_013910 [Phytophthora pseudosyringae]|uniref:Uncharacterized protein n=1 Tax=Phytophthora pseudosyringae TaxID=221518 RepID=A0A8T1W637_9STRA|nr:hypothetical protein PHYPSEUDO_013910 [Phytophthora pseudosyringae]
MALVWRVLLAASSSEECDAFDHFLQPQEPSTKQGLDVGLLSSEPPVLPRDGNDEGRNSSQSLLEDLLLYLAVRELAVTAESAGDNAILGVDAQTLQHWEQCEGRQRTQIKCYVGTLHGLLLKSEWDAVSVATLGRVVKRLQNPRARQRFLAFAVQVLRLMLQSKDSLPVSKAGQLSEMEVKLFDEAVRLLLLGATDLWSAIRKDCAKTAAAIAFEFSSQSHIEQLMDSLLCVAIGSRSVSADKRQVTAWTEREGALLALSVLLRSVVMDSTGRQVTADKETDVSQVKDDIKGILGVRQVSGVRYHLGSRHTLTQLPRCLVQTLKPAMYQCLRHDQLGVRQLAAQCLVEYASLCEEPTRLLIFQEVISKLNRINRNEKVTEGDSAENPDESELLDAFEAEGLLDVLARMTPCLPSTFLLKHWNVVFPTLEKYVMHIASSVRQKSSSVVLALAVQSLSREVLASSATSTCEEASLKLVVQMLLSLSRPQSDGNGFCWQRKEGRLLSIDVLVSFLGESLLECRSDACKLLIWKPEPTKSRQRRSSSLTDVQTYMWAHEQARSATWVLDTNEVERHQAAFEGIDHATAESESLVHTIRIWIEKNNAQDGLPASSHEFWQQVLSGCIAQTKEVFESSQFELRRISRQVLPGLMRLVIWADQLTFLASTELETTSGETSWGWMCMKYILLHLRYLEESMVALGGNVETSTSQQLATNWENVWRGIVALENNAQCISTESEATVAKVEVKVMAFLSFGARADLPHQVTQFLDDALRSIIGHIPKTMQPRAQLEAERVSFTSDSSLDRQFCTSLVPILPAVVSSLQYLDERHGRNDSSPSDRIQSREVDLSRSSRWLCLERIILSWLLCDDMFRWITLSKSEAQSQLLESLRMLLHFPRIDLPRGEESEEIDNITQCLQETFAASQTKGTRMKDASYTSLMDIYLQLWLRCITKGCHSTDKVVVIVAQLYSQRQHNVASADAKTERGASSSTCAAAESWGDWDDDEDQVQEASPVGHAQDLQGSPSSDSLFQEVLESLDVNQLNLLREAARGIPDLPGVKGLPTRDITRMQQQIQACL